MALQAGQKHTIYQQPLTEEDAEGEATLLRKHCDDGFWDGRRVERWWVEFPGDAEGDEFPRTILTPDN